MKKIILLAMALIAIQVSLAQTTTQPLNDVKVNGVYYNIDKSKMIAEVTFEDRSSRTNYSGLTSVKIPETITHMSKTYTVTSIGLNAFQSCKSMTSIEIPNTVTLIDLAAFQGCSGLTSIEIPSSITSINGFAFQDCTGLNAVYITDLEAWCNIEFSSLNSNPLCYAHHLYLNNEEVKDLIIPESITKLSDSAFEGCSGLTSVVIPNSVTKIGDETFAGCSGLTHLEIPNSIKDIPLMTFEGCSGLKSVVIPNSITRIGSGAFRDCTSLKSVEIPNSVNTIWSCAFKGCTGLTDLYIGEGLSYIQEDVFSNCNSLEKIVVWADTPPFGEPNTFDTFTYSNATLYVREETLDRYKNAYPWAKFSKFMPIDENGVEEIATDKSDILYDIVNLNGQVVKSNATQSDIDALSPGIYIIGGRKVVIK